MALRGKNSSSVFAAFFPPFHSTDRSIERVNWASQLAAYHTANSLITGSAKTNWFPMEFSSLKRVELER